ncbi:transposase [uncultured Fibrobacter sp.]|uniref:transposase n=1 Tax=uncultured Fibrobacter sp. TaxID=261512 RepID=UPI0028053BA6|nr:transposase [uncultured Fibrobacter sp.]
MYISNQGATLWQKKTKKKKTVKRRLSAEEKANITSSILLEGKSVSAVAEEYRISPNRILSWRKELIEGAVGIFAQKRPDITEKAQQRRIDSLERTLAAKDAVIADIAQENLVLKKKLTGRP